VSSPPLKGSFAIACKNSDDTEFVSRDLHIWEDTDLMMLYLSWEIPHLMLKTHIYNTGKYAYRENGMEFAIVFQDLHDDPKQCEIRSGATTKLEGGKTIAYKNTTPRPYGENIMFEPVPLEMLYHDADKPQVMVKVKGLEGICSGFNCDFEYKAATSEITAQALANDKEITITGTGLPTTDVSVVLGNAKCGTVTASDTQITCTLAVLPAAGDWDVKVFEPKGLVPIKAGVAKITVALVVDSITPSTGLN